MDAMRHLGNALRVPASATRASLAHRVVTESVQKIAGGMGRVIVALVYATLTGWGRPVRCRWLQPARVIQCARMEHSASMVPATAHKGSRARTARFPSLMSRGLILWSSTVALAYGNRPLNQQCPERWGPRDHCHRSPARQLLHQDCGCNGPLLPPATRRSHTVRPLLP